MFTSRHFMTEWAHLWLGGVYTKNVGIWENTFTIDNQDMTYVRSEYFQDRPCKNNIRGKMSHKEMTNLRTVEPQPKPRKSTRYLEMKIYLILGQMETYLDTVPAPGDHPKQTPSTERCVGHRKRPPPDPTRVCSPTEGR